MSPLTHACQTQRRRRDERGGGGTGQWSIPVLLMIPMFMALAGLVIDGGRQVMSAREAQAVAASAARAGVDAAATGQLAGNRVDTAAAVGAARSYLSSTQVSGSVQLAAGGRLAVTTSMTQPTLYLGLIGIDSVTGRGEATAALFGPGEGGN